MNEAKTVAGAMFLDYSQALNLLVGNLTSSELNITDPSNIKVEFKKACLTDNIFTNNTA
jgi:hypothetical protein